MGAVPHFVRYRYNVRKESRQPGSRMVGSGCYTQFLWNAKVLGVREYRNTTLAFQFFKINVWPAPQFLNSSQLRFSYDILSFHVCIMLTFFQSSPSGSRLIKNIITSVSQGWNWATIWRGVCPTWFINRMASGDSSSSNSITGEEGSNRHTKWRGVFPYTSFSCAASVYSS